MFFSHGFLRWPTTNHGVEPPRDRLRLQGRIRLRHDGFTSKKHQISCEKLQKNDGKTLWFSWSCPSRYWRCSWQPIQWHFLVLEGSSMNLRSFLEKMWHISSEEELQFLAQVFSGVYRQYRFLLLCYLFFRLAYSNLTRYDTKHSIVWKPLQPTRPHKSVPM